MMVAFAPPAYSVNAQRLPYQLNSMPPSIFFLPSSNSKKSYELRNTAKVQKHQVFSMILYCVS